MFRLLLDTEELSAKLAEYYAALWGPHEMRNCFHRARVFLSGVEAGGANPGTAEMVSARRALTCANANVNMPARRSSDLRTKEAREAMEEVRARIENDFYVTSFDSPYMPAEPPFPEMGASGGARKSDSNRQEPNPRARPRV